MTKKFIQSPTETVILGSCGNKYRIQTGNERVHNMLKRRKSAELCAEGINTNLWVYEMEFSSLRNAKEAVARYNEKE